VAGLQNQRKTTRQRPGGLVRPGLTTIPMPSVEVDNRTVYDFLVSASSDYGELDDLLPEDRTWITESRAARTTEIGSGASANACIPFVGEISRMVVLRPEIRNARQLVAAVDDIADSELLECMLGELLDNAELGPIARRTLDGDSVAFDELSRHLMQNKGHEVLPNSVGEVAPGARQVLHAWLPHYERVEARVGVMLDRDVSDRRMADAASDPLGFVEGATNGIRMVPEQAIRRIVLAPTYFGRPYNTLAKVNDIQLLVYPIADSALGAAGRAVPPAATLRLYRALGDESRLRILRLLVDRDLYLTELAIELNLSKPTVSHHLAQLRSAGLVTTTEQGNLTYYTLRRDRIEQAGPELGAFLAR
jgi:DNA-binding transcriptional ArsR family regulator